MSERVVAQVVLWASVVLAVAGAALGTAYFDGLNTAQMLLVASFSGLFGIMVTLLLLRGPSEKMPEEQPIPPQAQAQAQAPAPKPMPALPAPAPKTNNQWWDQTGKPAGAPPAAQAATKAVPLTDFDAHRVQIAQCPRCAGFELDVRRDGRAYAFTCHNPHCRNSWEWRPGTAWPPTVVRHNLIMASPAEGERR